MTAGLAIEGSRGSGRSVTDWHLTTRSNRTYRDATLCASIKCRIEYCSLILALDDRLCRIEDCNGETGPTWRSSING